MRKQHEQHHEAGKPHDEHAESVQAAFQTAQRRRRFKRGGNAAKTGAVASGGDQHQRGAAHQYGAAEQRVECCGGFGRGAGARPFVDGEGFAGEQGLVELCARGFQDDAIGRNEIAGGELDDVAGHNFFNGRFNRAAIAPHRRVHRHRMLQGLHRLFRTMFLRHLQPDRGGENGENDGAAREVTDSGGDDRRNDENGDERINQPMENLAEHMMARRLRHHIAATCAQAARCLSPAQPCGGGSQPR